MQGGTEDTEERVLAMLWPSRRLVTVRKVPVRAVGAEGTVERVLAATVDAVAGSSKCGRWSIATLLTS